MHSIIKTKPKSVKIFIKKKEIQTIIKITKN